MPRQIHNVRGLLRLKTTLLAVVGTVGFATFAAIDHRQSNDKSHHDQARALPVTSEMMVSVNQPTEKRNH